MSSIPWELIEAALPTLEPVGGGYTKATRGLVTLTGNQKVFVKIAVDEQTRNWIQKERKAYDFLTAQNFAFAPRLVSETDGGIAMPDLSSWDWSKTWIPSKMDAVLRAMDALAPLGANARHVFGDFDLEPAMWESVPRTIEAYAWTRPILAQSVYDELTLLMEDAQVLAAYAALSESRPWQGSDLIHNDVRSDNFAFNRQTGEGLLVDWNWICMGTKAFDTASLLVDMDQAGADVSSYLKRADKASMAYIIGYWLGSATEVPDSEHMVTLRVHQLESALTAHNLTRQL